MENINRTRLLRITGDLDNPSRIILTLTVLCAACLIWLAPHPPLADLPQHAGQVALLRDIILGKSRWSNIVEINYFTPYILFYGLATALSLVFSVAASLKILITVNYIMMFAACVQLRKAFDGSPHLDWLAIPGFFGFAFQWGFVSFLFAAPFGIMFIIFAKRCAENPTWRRNILFTLFGILTFFSHGLIFVFSALIGGLFVFLRAAKTGFRVQPMLSLALPYLFFAAVMIIYMWVSTTTITQRSIEPHRVEWGSLQLRLREMLVFITADEEDRYAGPMTIYPPLLALLLFPLALGLPVRRHFSAAHLPAIAGLMVWFLCPSFALSTAFLYQRFSVFTLPFYALLFGVKQKKPGQSSVRPAIALGMVILSCWFIIKKEADHLIDFAKESKAFEAMTALAEPGQMALYLVFDRTSPAAHSRIAYRHFPAWYQAEQGGFVEFNFAWFLPQIAVYRPSEIDTAFREVSSADDFRWSMVDARRYSYIFVRHSGKPPDVVTSGAPCAITLIARQGSWWLYRGCADHK